MATPHLDEAERCGRVALLHEGVVMALDEPATLQSALPGIMLEVSAEGARPPIEALGRLPGVDDVQLRRSGARAPSSEESDAAGRVATGLKDAGIVAPRCGPFRRHSKTCSSTWSPAPEMRATVSRCMEHDVLRCDGRRLPSRSCVRPRLPPMARSFA